MDQVNISTLFPYVNEFLTVVGAGLVLWLGSWLGTMLQKHAGLLDQQTDGVLVDAFERALSNGIKIGMAKLSTAEGVNDQVTASGWLAKIAGQYAVDHSPDYVARFLGDATPDEMVQHAAQKALALLPPAPIIAQALPNTKATSPKAKG